MNHQKVRLLAYTRSRSFDYSWIYGFNDREEQRRFEEFLLNWIGVNQLAALPPVSVLFKFENRVNILIARQSGRRTDLSGRPIFERALVSWKRHEPLAYRHISSLHKLLLGWADEIFENIPNDAVRAPKDTKEIDIELDDLEVPNPDDEEAWKLPCGLSWEAIISNKLVVKAPPAWSFSKLLRPILDMQLSEDRLVCIGSALPLGSRLEGNESWIISPPKSEAQESQSEDVLIMNKKGMPISSDDIDKLKKSMAMTPAATLQASASARNESEKESTKEPTKILDDFYSYIAERDKIFAAPDKERVSEWLLRYVGLGKNEDVRDGLFRLSLLLTPVHFSGGADLAFAWANLLAEICLFNKQCSVDMERHWLQRLRSLEDISLACCGQQSQSWRDDFRNSCMAVHNLIAPRK